jgi:hypothetical protein
MAASGALIPLHSTEDSLSRANGEAIALIDYRTLQRICGLEDKLGMFGSSFPNSHLLRPRS